LERPVTRVATNDGLGLGISSTGSFVSLEVDGKEIGGQPALPAGFSAFDWGTLEPMAISWPIGEIQERFREEIQLALVSGEWKNGEIVGTFQGLDIELQAKVASEGDYLRVEASVEDRRKATRSVTFYVGFPVDATLGWHWRDGLNRSREVIAGQEYVTVPPGLMPMPIGPTGQVTHYPWSSLDGPVGLSLAVPMDEPRVFRLIYAPDAGLLLAAFDLCFTPEVKAWPSRSSFTVFLYRHDPEWGFRAAAKRYYDLFPEWFERRFSKWDTRQNADESSGTETAVGEDKQGVYSFVYVDATNLFLTLEDEEDKNPVPREVLQRLRWIANPRRKEPLPEWKYFYPGREWLPRIAPAWLRSLILDEKGLPFAFPDKKEFDLLVAKYVPCNASPGIPGGLGEFMLKEYFPEADKKVTSASGQPDGFGFDSFGARGTFVDRDMRHMRHMALPPTFTRDDWKPATPKDFATYELIAVLAKDLQARDRHIMVNWCQPGPFPFVVQFLDVFGIELNAHMTMEWARALMYQKPVTCWTYMIKPQDLERWMTWNLRWGVFSASWKGTLDEDGGTPGITAVLRKETELGWEPVTHARARNVSGEGPAVFVERFGPKAGEMILALYTDQGEMRTAEVSVDLSALGLGLPLVAENPLDHTTIPVEVREGKGVLQAQVVPRGATPILVSSRM